MPASRQVKLLSGVFGLFRPPAMRLESILILSLLLWIGPMSAAQAQSSTGLQSAAGVRAVRAQPSTASQEISKPAVQPSPGRAAEASAYAQAQYRLYFLRFGWTAAVLLLLLRLRVAPRFPDWAESLKQDRFLEALIFAPCFLLTLDALLLPVDVVEQSVKVHFGQSAQSWGAWLWSQAKGDLLGAAAGALLIWLVMTIVRRSPRRWWFYGWLGALPIIVFSTFVNPLLIDPLFFRFTPLADSRPDLVKQMERVIARSGQRIPENRIFLMNASRSVNAANAYMTGLGASSRVVVWDTTLARMSTPEILVVFGHELGHYVLWHHFQGIVFSLALLLLTCWIGFHVFYWMLRRFGRTWGLRAADDWAALPLALLILFLLSTAATPADNAFTRHLEHQADQYGLEVVHGIVPGSSNVAADAYKIISDVDLLDRSPSPLAKIWFYDHPPIQERIRYAYEYNPWAPGRSPQFVK